MPFLDQNAVETLSKTVTQAIDAGTIGIAVLLAVGLIVMGLGIGLLVWKVIVPLLRQVIQLTSQVTTMVERTHDAIEHSNETNKLMAQAQNSSTGETQGMRKDIREMVQGFGILSLSFGNYQTLQSDTTDALRSEMVAFKSEIKDEIEAMLKLSGATLEQVTQAIENHQIIFKKLDELIALLPSPTPSPTNVTNVTNVNTGAVTEKPTDTEDEAA